VYHEIVGKNITRIALSKYRSLKAFCEENGLSYESVWKITKMKHSPSLRTLETIAEALEINVTELFKKE